MSIFSKKSSPPKAKPHGKLIVLDGTDGSGKATQSQLLKENLEAQGYKVAVLEFPRYNSETAGPLKKYLAGGFGTLSAKQAAVLYAVDRFDAKPEIKTLLAEGIIVIADRYVTSNAGHQGAKIEDENERIQFFRWLNDLEYNIFNLPKPDLNLILHLPAQIAFDLVQNREVNADKVDVMHENNLEHLRMAEKVYLEIGQIFPNTKVIECASSGELLPPQEIANQIWEVVRRVALKSEFPPIENQ